MTMFLISLFKAGYLRFDISNVQYVQELYVVGQLVFGILVINVIIGTYLIVVLLGADFLVDKIILFTNDIFDPNFGHQNSSLARVKLIVDRYFMIILNIYDYNSISIYI
ncbi:MAG: hypothetical protein QM487_15805 [Candidatus Marithrix sp.]